MKIADHAAVLVAEDPTLREDHERLAQAMATRTGKVFKVQRIKHILWEIGKYESMGVSLAPDVVNGADTEDVEEAEETPEQRETRIRGRFEMQDRLVQRVINGSIRSLVISGPPGVGKSNCVERALEGTDESKIKVFSGTISAPGLIIAAWKHREEGNVIVFDDCDDVFRTEVSLAILKAMLDTSQKRIVSYTKLADFLEKEDIPQSFEFNGSVIFLTNIDFEREIQRANRAAPHMLAIMDRSRYLCLTLRTMDDFLTRIRHLAEIMIENEEERMRAIDFIAQHSEIWHLLSGRLVLHIHEAMQHGNGWEEEILMTKSRSL